MVQVLELHVGEGHHGEGLVDLVQVHVTRRHARVLEGARHGQGRGGGEKHRGLLSVSEASNDGQRLRGRMFWEGAQMQKKEEAS